ncbi:hypothetical protein ACFLZX_00115 [Nanoarchaeota archaeon]
MKNNIWKILSWIAFLIVFLYLFFKIIGVIHSPLSIDLVALISGAYIVGRYAKMFDDMYEDLGLIKSDMNRIKQRCSIFRSN